MNRVSLFGSSVLDSRCKCVWKRWTTVSRDEPVKYGSYWRDSDDCPVHTDTLAGDPDTKADQGVG